MLNNTLITSRRSRFGGVAVLALSWATGPAPVALQADENALGFTCGADTLPKGAPQIYQIGTSRTGKAADQY
jgi:hypothetical protein